MSQQIAVGECSTEEDLGIEWVFASGYDPAGKTLEVAVRERSSATIKTTLTVGSGLSIVGASVKARVSKATMSAWARTEYTTDLVDKTGGAPKRLVPTRIIFDEPGKLVGGISGNSFRVTQAENRFVVTATTGETGPVGPAINLSKGALTILPPGSQPNFSISGSSPNFAVDMSLTEGPAGAGAPTSADILALADRDDFLREIAGAGVSDRPIAVLDFVRGVHWVKGAYAGASILALVAALPGSVFSRPTTATYFDSDGLMKTAAVGVPRIDYNPVSRTCRGFLSEPQRTNLRSYSEQFDQAVYTKFSSNVTANAALAPNGLTEADVLVEDASSNTHAIFGNSTAYISGTTYSKSVFVRRASGSRDLRLSFDQAVFETNGRIATFNLGAGTVSFVQPGVTASIQSIGGGWFRASISATAIASGNGTFQMYMIDGGSVSYQGGGVSSLAFWGAQLEEGSAPSSYIPTTASTVTRSRDGLSLGASGWYQQTGTILAEALLESPLPNASWFRLTGAVIGDNINVRSTSAILGQAVISTVGDPQTSIVRAGGALPAGAHRVAFAYEPGNVAASWNGAATQLGTGVQNVPPNLSTLHVGCGQPSVEVLGGHVRRILIYPKRLTDAKLLILANQSMWS